MSVLHKIENTFNQLFRFPREDRALFYDVVIVQLEAGLTLKQIFETIDMELNISKEMSLAAAAGHQAIREGRSGIEGLGDSNMFPADEIFLLTAAEDKNALLSCLKQLSVRAQSSATFFRDVVAPNTYYLGIAAALTYVLFQAKGLVDSFGSIVSLDNNDAYATSVALNQYGPSVLVGFIVLSLFLYYCSCHLYHPLRRVVPFFAKDIQLQYGVRFCALSSMFYDIGATHGDILRAAENIFGGSGFMRGAIAELRTSYESEGSIYNEAVGQTILSPEIASVLIAMVPGEERDAFSPAHRAVERLQLNVLRKRHSSARVMFQLALLATISFMLLTMLIGLYSLYDFKGT